MENNLFEQQLKDIFSLQSTNCQPANTNIEQIQQQDNSSNNSNDDERPEFDVLNKEEASATCTDITRQQSHEWRFWCCSILCSIWRLSRPY
jgi:hypothetical protein